MCRPGRCTWRSSCQPWLCHCQHPSCLLWLATLVASFSTFMSFLRHGISYYLAYQSSYMVFPSLLNAKIMSNNLIQTRHSLTVKLPRRKEGCLILCEQLGFSDLSEWNCTSHTYIFYDTGLSFFILPLFACHTTCFRFRQDSFKIRMFSDVENKICTLLKSTFKHLFPCQHIFNSVAKMYSKYAHPTLQILCSQITGSCWPNCFPFQKKPKIYL